MNIKSRLNFYSRLVDQHANSVHFVHGHNLINIPCWETLSRAELLLRVQQEILTMRHLQLQMIHRFITIIQEKVLTEICTTNVFSSCRAAQESLSAVK